MLASPCSRKEASAPEEGEEDDEAEWPDRFDESFEGVGAQKTASSSGDDDVAWSKPQLEGRRTRQDVVDLIDCVID